MAVDLLFVSTSSWEWDGVISVYKDVACDDVILFRNTVACDVAILFCILACDVVILFGRFRCAEVISFYKLACEGVIEVRRFFKLIMLGDEYGAEGVIVLLSDEFFNHRDGFCPYPGINYMEARGINSFVGMGYYIVTVKCLGVLSTAYV